MLRKHWKKNRILKDLRQTLPHSGLRPTNSKYLIYGNRMEHHFYPFDPLIWALSGSYAASLRA